MFKLGPFKRQQVVFLSSDCKSCFVGVFNIANKTENYFCWLLEWSHDIAINQNKRDWPYKIYRDKISS